MYIFFPTRQQLPPQKKLCLKSLLYSIMLEGVDLRTYKKNNLSQPKLKEVSYLDGKKEKGKKFHLKGRKVKSGNNYGDNLRF